MKQLGCGQSDMGTLTMVGKVRHSPAPLSGFPTYTIHQPGPRFSMDDISDTTSHTDETAETGSLISNPSSFSVDIAIPLTDEIPEADLISNPSSFSIDDPPLTDEIPVTIYKDSCRNHTKLFRFLSPLFFFFPDAHLRELEKLWTDDIIVETFWQDFTEKLVSEWTDFVLYVSSRSSPKDPAWFDTGEPDSRP